MASSPKLLSFGWLGLGGLLMASCQEGTSSQPNPKAPPLTVKIIYPKGSRPGDSAYFDQIMRGKWTPTMLL